METKEKVNDYTKKLIILLAKKMEHDISKYNMDELCKGMVVELEHGTANEKTNVTSDDPEQTFRLVLAHMEELPDYYTRLEKMEKEAGSVKTKKVEEKDDDEELKKEKGGLSENAIKRYKELCGLNENKEKRQLKNQIYQEREKKLLKEEVDPKKFDIIKFTNDGLGKKSSDEEIDLYKMEKRKNSKS